jgi:hypothetical protein
MFVGREPNRFPPSRTAQQSTLSKMNVWQAPRPLRVGPFVREQLEASEPRLSSSIGEVPTHWLPKRNVVSLRLSTCHLLRAEKKSGVC